RLGFRRHGRPIVAAVRREAESRRRRAVPRVANAGEGRAVDAERRGNTCKESRGQQRLSIIVVQDPWPSWAHLNPPSVGSSPTGGTANCQFRASYFAGPS